LLESLLSRHPEHVVGRFHAGRAAFELRRFERAERHFQKLLDLDHESALPQDMRGWVHLYRGWLAELAGDRQEALRRYKRVRRLRRFDAYRAGELYEALPYEQVPSREVDVWALFCGKESGEEPIRAKGSQ
jgi:tetratricopeptide (TPR) repeat protein